MSTIDKNQAANALNYTIAGSAGLSAACLYFNATKIGRFANAALVLSAGARILVGKVEPSPSQSTLPPVDLSAMIASGVNYAKAAGRWAAGVKAANAATPAPLPATTLATAPESAKIHTAQDVISSTASPTPIPFGIIVAPPAPAKLPPAATTATIEASERIHVRGMRLPLSAIFGGDQSNKQPKPKEIKTTLGEVSRLELELEQKRSAKKTPQTTATPKTTGTKSTTEFSLDLMLVPQPRKRKPHVQTLASIAEEPEKTTTTTAKQTEVTAATTAQTTTTAADTTTTTTVPKTLAPETTAAPTPVQPTQSQPSRVIQVLDWLGGLLGADDYSTTTEPTLIPRNANDEAAQIAQATKKSLEAQPRVPCEPFDLAVGTISQSDVAGGRTACTSIALTALQLMLQDEIHDCTHIDEVVRSGVTSNQRIITNGSPFLLNAKEQYLGVDQCQTEFASKLRFEQNNGVEGTRIQLSPNSNGYLVPLQELQVKATKTGKQQGAVLFMYPFTYAVSISPISHIGNIVQFFDSHGFLAKDVDEKNPSVAANALFKTVDQLADYLNRKRPYNPNAAKAEDNLFGLYMCELGDGTVPPKTLTPQTTTTPPSGQNDAPTTTTQVPPTITTTAPPAPTDAPAEPLEPISSEKITKNLALLEDRQGQIRTRIQEFYLQSPSLETLKDLRPKVEKQQQNATLSHQEMTALLILPQQTEKKRVKELLQSIGLYQDLLRELAQLILVLEATAPAAQQVVPAAILVSDAPVLHVQQDDALEMEDMVPDEIPPALQTKPAAVSPKQTLQITAEQLAKKQKNLTEAQEWTALYLAQQEPGLGKEIDLLCEITKYETNAKKFQVQAEEFQALQLTPHEGLAIYQEGLTQLLQSLARLRTQIGHKPAVHVAQAASLPAAPPSLKTTVPKPVPVTPATSARRTGWSFFGTNKNSTSIN